MYTEVSHMTALFIIHETRGSHTLLGTSQPLKILSVDDNESVTKKITHILSIEGTSIDMYISKEATKVKNIFRAYDFIKVRMNLIFNW